ARYAETFEEGTRHAATGPQGNRSRLVWAGQSRTARRQPPDLGHSRRRGPLTNGASTSGNHAPPRPGQLRAAGSDVGFGIGKLYGGGRRMAGPSRSFTRQGAHND